MVFQISVHVLKHQHKLIVCVDSIVQADDVVMLKLSHERNLTDGRGWSAFFRIDMNFFERNISVVLTIKAFENLYAMLGWLSLREDQK